MIDQVNHLQLISMRVVNWVVRRTYWASIILMLSTQLHNSMDRSGLQIFYHQGVPSLSPYAPFVKRKRSSSTPDNFTQNRLYNWSSKASEFKELNICLNKS